jgi:hypothetical protein
MEKGEGYRNTTVGKWWWADSTTRHICREIRAIEAAVEEQGEEKSYSGLTSCHCRARFDGLWGSSHDTQALNEGSCVTFLTCTHMRGIPSNSSYNAHTYNSQHVPIISWPSRSYKINSTLCCVATQRLPSIEQWLCILNIEDTNTSWQKRSNQYWVVIRSRNRPLEVTRMVIRNRNRPQDVIWAVLRIRNRWTDPQRFSGQFLGFITMVLKKSKTQFRYATTVLIAFWKN